VTSPAAAGRPTPTPAAHLPFYAAAKEGIKRHLRMKIEE